MARPLLGRPTARWPRCGSGSVRAGRSSGNEPWVNAKAPSDFGDRRGIERPKANALAAPLVEFAFERGLRVVIGQVDRTATSKAVFDAGLPLESLLPLAMQHRRQPGQSRRSDDNAQNRSS